MSSAGIVREDLAEVVVAHVTCTGAPKDQVRGTEQGPVTRVLPEVIRAARDLSTELPDALAALDVGGAEPRIEVRRGAVIGRRYQRAPRACYTAARVGL